MRRSINVATQCPASRFTDGLNLNSIGEWMVTSFTPFFTCIL